MALNESLQLLAGTHQRFILGVEDTLTEKNVLLNLLKSRNRIKFGMSGTNIEWQVKTQFSSTIRGWRDLDEIDFTREANYDTAALNWKGYAGSYTISKWDRKLNVGGERIFDIQRTELETLEDGILQEIEIGLFDDGTAQDGNRGITGLEAFMKATGTYADIAQTNSFWQAQVIAGNAGPNASFAVDALERMATAYVQSGRGGGKFGTFRQVQAWITDRDTWIRVHSTIQANERFQQGRDEGFAQAGFPNILVMGRPLFWADQATANRLYGLNFDVLQLDIVGDRMLEAEQETSISPKAFIGTFDGMMQLRCSSPRHQVVITDTNT